MKSLPCFTFAREDGGTQTFDPARHAHWIAALAAELRGSFRPGSAVGLLFRTGPTLVGAWLACLAAELEPLVLQYPTKKQSRPYWLNSVAHTIELTRLACIVAESNVVASGIDCPVLVPSPLAEDQASAEMGQSVELPDDFAILQLSSGTTGFRKAMRFTRKALSRHVSDFNARLGLDGSDVIASWLPLYHDLGYIACFVMPMMLGVRTVMMDPMDWVSRPERLFDLIDAAGATTCFMPNFGYEVMARVQRPAPASMRRWVWSAEPASAATVRRFATATGAREDSLFALYGMAENVLTITYGPARTVFLDDVPRVSCGAPIDGVALRIQDGEIWVKSSTAIEGYLHGLDIRGPDGYYPTGDLGTFVDGALVVHGRKRDVLVQAGRKILLSDVDLVVQELAPEVRGRASTIAVADAALGTETALVLLECTRFYARTDSAALALRIKDATDLAAASAAFVPPFFLTKTSSGKYNRPQIAANWARRRDAAPRPAGSQDRLADTLRRDFPNIDPAIPLRQALDSLSLAVLAVDLGEAGIALDPERSLAAHVSLAAIEPPKSGETLRIVSLADRFTLPVPAPEMLEQIGATLGVTITFEHVCLPPSPVILSDLVFSDYFAGRLEDGVMASVDAALDRLRGASVIVTDDMSELYYLYESTYPVLSHRLERVPAADLISMRWQSYVRQHHSLPIDVVAGVDLPMSACRQSLAAITAYIGVPFFRMASVPGLGAFTEGWQYRDFAPMPAARRGERFWPAFARWVAEGREPLRMRPRRSGPSVLANDLAHFCSTAVNPEAIDAVVAQYESFAVFGQEASLPALRTAIEKAGKPYVLRPSYAAGALTRSEFEVECYVACGAFGSTETEKPFVALQHVGQPWRTRNLGAFAQALPPLNRPLESGSGWYCEFELERLRDYAVWSDARRRKTA